MDVNDQWWTLLHYATMAPSSHNTQPWRFRVQKGTAELRADRSRALPVVDPDGRELVISCGAALLHLRVAVHHFGFGERTVILPDADDPDLLARIELTQRPSGSSDDALFEAISQRRTNRLPFEPEPLPRDLLPEVEDAARAEGAWLTPIRADADRRRLAELIAEGDLIQAGDPNLRREMAEWVRANDSARRDGLRGYSFGHGRLASLLAPIYIKYAGWGETQAASDRELALTAPVIAVLGTETDDAGAWMQAGQALGRVLLVAQSRGISASFLNQPIQVASLRDSVRVIAGASGYPQLCLRFGRGREVRPSPRRPLEDVIDNR
ncbi:MAG TPA: nitroreductase family protein [Bryobacteraceae bacterium]|nr:nitroreductase family protein [Bryobacteraceae bacterium]